MPANNLAELIKLAKASPGKLNYGSAGPGTTPHIGAELLKQEAGIELTHVPYKGAAPAVTGAARRRDAGGHGRPAERAAARRGGTLKVLAVAGPSRAPQLPDVPTTKEAGLPSP